MWYVSSNRDETRYEDPDRFDVRRNPEHQAFGAGGRHFCLGTALARLELRILFEETLKRYPQMELAGKPEYVVSRLREPAADAAGAAGPINGALTHRFLYVGPMSLGGAISRPRRARLAVHVPTWSSSAWWAIAGTSAFVLLTLWWLTQDQAVPYGDAAEELWAAFRFRDYLLRGDIGAIFEYPAYYPPYGLLLGGLMATVGGVGRNAVVLGVNLVCVPLLALSCYRVGRMVAGPQAGALAVVFALGSPLLIEQFHVFIIDAPEATIVAASVWLTLLSDRFERVGIAALAGLAVGIGTGTKAQFPLYLAGLVAVVLLRGGWRNARGFAAFAVVAVAVAAPWYVEHADRLWLMWRAAGTGEGLLFPVPPLARPPLLSSANVQWYGWATLNGLLFAPLTAFALVGVVDAGRRLWRRGARVRASSRSCSAASEARGCC